MRNFTPIRDIPYMGVIHVVAEAAKLGFRNGHPDWCNLGQGQPEVGPLAGAPDRLCDLRLRPEDHAYGPVGGLPELREAVAEHYNRLYRRGRGSRYTADNVAIAAGGRLMLSRVFAAFGPVNLGYQTPDYTAYEEMLDSHRHRFTPVLVPTHEADGFRVNGARFERLVEDQGLGGYVFSNPNNPTGETVAGEDLAHFVGVARRTGCVLVADEFYSQFVYDAHDGPVSAAAYIDDVERDPVVLVDGLTKGFRYPGWRIGWAVGPSEIIEAVARSASAIDGGPPIGMQRLAIEALEPSRADQETAAVRTAFRAKRDLMRTRLEAHGVRFVATTPSTFYLWGCIADLPPPFNDAEAFFRAALERQVMVVPGQHFDVDPTGSRPNPRFGDWLRFSFGPPMDNLRLGLDRLDAMLSEGAARHA